LTRTTNSNIEITGTLKFAGELNSMELAGHLLEGHSPRRQRRRQGNLNVNSVVLRGKINGNVTAKEKIDIKAKTELFGDIRSPKLVIEEGVTFVGKSEVNPVASIIPTQPLSSEGAKTAPSDRRVLVQWPERRWFRPWDIGFFSGLGVRPSGLSEILLTASKNHIRHVATQAG
jgi:cytoskeletal protein CcmA (bactofilin family)